MHRHTCTDADFQSAPKTETQYIALDVIQIPLFDQEASMIETLTVFENLPRYWILLGSQNGSTYVPSYGKSATLTYTKPLEKPRH